MNKIILINQRLDKFGKHKEVRDNLDPRLVELILKINMRPLIIPNNIQYLKKIFLSNKYNIRGIILSPGGNPKIKNVRSKIEEMLIIYAKKNKIPLLGICRGAQKINLFFKGKISKIKNHVKKEHNIYGNITDQKIIKVNSYHDYGISCINLSKDFDIYAKSNDGFVESFKHKTKKILGIMWHPERYKKMKNFDKKILLEFFRCN